MRRSILIAFVVACGAFAAPPASAQTGFEWSTASSLSQRQSVFLRTPLTGCFVTNADACLPDRLFEVAFYNPNFGYCEYAITVQWGDGGHSEFILRDQNLQSYVYAHPGIYHYRASSPPGTAIVPGADCPAGEQRYLIEIPLTPTQARLYRKVVQLAKTVKKEGKKPEHVDTHSETKDWASGKGWLYGPGSEEYAKSLGDKMIDAHFDTDNPKTLCCQYDPNNPLEAYEAYQFVKAFIRFCLYYNNYKGMYQRAQDASNYRTHPGFVQEG